MIWLRYWPVAAVGLGLFGWRSAWAAILLYHGGIGLALWRRPGCLPLLRQGWRPAWMLGGLLLGLLAAPVVRWGSPFVLGEQAGSDLAGTLRLHGLRSGALMAFSVYFVTVHPVLEELAWRGILRSDGGVVGRTDVEFAAYHLVVLHALFPGRTALLAVAAVSLVLLSAFWRAVAHRSGGLAVPVCLHAGADAGLLWGAFSLAWDVPLA